MVKSKPVKTPKPKASNKILASPVNAPGKLPVLHTSPASSFDSAQLDTFLYWIRERHSIHLLRAAQEAQEPTTRNYRSASSPPWTRDSILQNIFFCNPFRENDKTTRWFANNLRNPLRDSPLVVLATVAFRWFNFIPTGETLSRWDEEDTINPNNPDPIIYNFFRRWDSRHVRSVLHHLSDCGSKVFTGAYIIKSPNGQNKIDGICDCIDIVARCLNWLKGSAILPKEIRVALPQYSPQAVEWCDEEGDEIRCDFLHDLLLGQLTLQQAHEGFMLFPFLGDFMAYEVVTDLRHTKYLCNAEDIMTWCNLGPGAIRGLLRLTGQFTPGPANGSYRAPRGAMDLMAELLEICQAYFGGLNERLAPIRCPTGKSSPAKVSKQPGVFPTFEMRDIEHSLCEFDKYSRVLNGEGQVKRIFDGS